MANTKGKKTAVHAEQDVIGDQLSFYASEAYKRLRTNLSFCTAGDGNCRVVGVTSTLRGEGKSTTSINLAYALAEDGKRVLLVDGDMRLSTIADRTGVNRKPGLSNFLAGNDNNVLQRSTLHERLYVISAGDAPPNPAELLGRGRVGSAIEIFRSKFDYIIFDLPPISEVVDALVVASNLDGLIVVTRRNYVTKRSLAVVMRQLRQANVNVLGFVMTYDEGFSSRFGKYGKSKNYGYYKKKGS